MVEVLLKYCPDTAEAFGTLRYKSRKGVNHAPASLLHCAIPRHDEGCKPHLAALAKLLIRKGLDLDLTDKNGNTPLLYSLFYRPLFKTTRVLLNAGANVQATNKHGENGLHLICRRLSACSRQNLSAIEKADIVDILARLIRGGLDPVAGNHSGWTPIDAAMSPVAWPLLCEAMRQVGKNMKDELLRLDKVARVSCSQADIDEKLAMATRGEVPQLTSLTLVTIDPLHSSVGICYLCGKSSPALPRQAPFDEFYSRVVNELDQGIDTMLYHHPKLEEGECLMVVEEDSCFALDYYPAKMSIKRLRERSWRRHVAAMLEERGLLPQD